MFDLLKSAKKNIVEQKSDEEKIKAIESLRSQGLDLCQTDSDSYGLLHWAMQNSGDTLFQWLIANAPTLMQNPLKDPFEQSDENYGQQQYPQKISNIYILFNMADGYKNSKMEHFFMSEGSNNCSLFEAVFYGHLNLVKLYHAKDPNSTKRADKRGNYPMHVAANQGHHHIIAYLIENESCFFNEKNIHGYTPFELAIINGHMHCFSLMIKNHAHLDVNFFSLAIKRGNLDVLKKLFELEEEIKAGYRQKSREVTPLVDMVDQNGNNPIHNIAELVVSESSLEVLSPSRVNEENAIEMMQLLLDHGANYDQCNYQAQSFIQYLFSRFGLWSREQLVISKGCPEYLFSKMFSQLIRENDKLLYAKNEEPLIELNVSEEELKKFDAITGINDAPEGAQIPVKNREALRSIPCLSINFKLKFYGWLFTSSQFSKIHFYQAIETLIRCGQKILEDFAIYLMQLYLKKARDEKEKNERKSELYFFLMEYASSLPDSGPNQILLELFIQFFEHIETISDENFIKIYDVFVKKAPHSLDFWKNFSAWIFNAWTKVSPPNFASIFTDLLMRFLKNKKLTTSFFYEFSNCIAGNRQNMEEKIARINFFLSLLLKHLIFNLNNILHENNEKLKDNHIAMTINLLGILDGIGNQNEYIFGLDVVDEIRNNLITFFNLTEKTIKHFISAEQYKKFLERSLDFISSIFPQYYSRFIAFLKNTNSSFAKYFFDFAEYGVFIGATITIDEGFKPNSNMNGNFLAFGLQFVNKDNQEQNSDDYRNALKNSISRFSTTAEEFKLVDLANAGFFLIVFGSILLDTSRFDQLLKEEIFTAYINLLQYGLEVYEEEKNSEENNTKSKMESIEEIPYEVILYTLRLLIDSKPDFLVKGKSIRPLLESYYRKAFTIIYSEVPSLVELCADVVITYRDQPERFQRERLLSHTHSGTFFGAIKNCSNPRVKVYNNLFFEVFSIFKSPDEEKIAHIPVPNDAEISDQVSKDEIFLKC